MKNAPSHPPDLLADTVADLVDQVVCQVLGEARAGLYLRRRALREMGLGSREMGDIRAALERGLGRPLDPLLFFRHATPDALIRHLASAPATSSGADRPAAAAVEPVAIIGMACRFPGGVSSPAAFWELLANGVDAITEVPPERWDMHELHGEGPGRIRSRFGGFLDGEVGRFDAPFFRIAPVEAAAMDPQQKLLLETHWEALEHAGLNPETLQGSATGLFVGTFCDDFKLIQAREPEIGLYYGTGTANAVTAGRLAYFLGTAGPAFSVDTACSASLVAVHQACQSLHMGESDLALASGVNLLLTPELSIAFSQANMLAPDGRCKTFDAGADGYVRSDGCGVVVLKRLSDALAAGDNILAVIRGTAINQDGASNGLTAPNGLAQEAVIRQALAVAGLDPCDIGYVEAHGTGTRLGDPIEVQALEAVYGPGRSATQPLVVGSLKTNIGHAEAAAGIAGLIKLVLTLQHGHIPPHLHLREINPYLQASAITIPTEGRPWPAQADAPPRRAAVSAFGFSGTNAHAIVEAAPVPRPNPTDAARTMRTQHLLTLSAQSPAALHELAELHAEVLAQQPDAALPAIADTLQQGRAHLGHRLTLVATTAREACAQLQTWLRGEETPSLVTGQPPASGANPKVAFLFTGQGSQYLRMGGELYATEPLFRDRIDRCDRVLHEVLGRSLVELLYPAHEPDHQDLLTSHPCGQAANFALECALSDLWRSWGVEPDLVLGHSLGDFAAAYTAGVLSLEDGLRLVTTRGRLMEAAHGRMLAVQAGEAEVLPFLAGHPDVALGVINGPQSVVISGAADGVATIADRLNAAGLKTRWLDIPVAAHSPLLDPVLDDFAAAVAAVPLAAPRLAVVSSMTGERIGDELADPQYWRRHLRHTVRFADGVRTLWREGCSLLVEVGPQGTLLGMAGLVLDAEGIAPAQRPLMLPSLGTGGDDLRQMLIGLGSLHTRGVPIDWHAFAGHTRHTPVVLPTYPFQRQPYPVPPGRRPQAGPAGASEAAPASTSSLVNDHLYVPTWERQSRTPALLAPAQAGRWLLVGEAGGVASTLASVLRELGEAVTLAGEVAQAADWLAQVDALPARGVVFVPALEDGLFEDEASDEATLEALQARLQHSIGGLLTLVQALSSSTASDASSARLWVATHRALPLDTRQPIALLQTPMAGFSRVAALELGARWGGLVDLDSGDSPVQRARALATELLQPRPDGEKGETEVAWRQGRRHVARLDRAAALPARAEPLALRPDGLYWITGGLGALGLQVARRLAAHGARHLLLTGRRGTVDAQTRAVLDALAADGVTVQVRAVDVADATAMRGLMDEVRAGAQTLRGVFHTAGVLDDGVLLNQDWARCSDALAAKVQGAWLLHRLTQGLGFGADLDLMVYFSSVAALLGNAGQGSYAAANAFLDGLSRWRRRQGLPALSIGWGIWADAGMAMRGETLSFSGVRPMAPELGLDALARLLPHAARFDGQVAVAALDWAALAEARPASRLHEKFVQPTASTGTDRGHGAARTPLREQLQALSPARRQAPMLVWLQQVVAAQLGMTEAPDSTTGFTDLGLDSLMALKLRHRLEGELGCALPSTLAFEYRSIGALAPFLLQKLQLDTDGPAANPVAAATPLPQVAASAKAEAQADDGAVAVIAMACRFPGAATPEDFWTLLRDGVDRIGEIPASRWDVEALYDPQRPLPGRMYVRQGAFVDDVEQFDPLFFGISPREAAGMDPKHGLLLETAWEVLERAGIAPSQLLDSATGVFIGTGVDNHGGIHDVADLKDLDTYAITSSGHSVAAGRLAYVLGLQGPTMAVDTACSSSLVALHLAVQSLRAGECQLALAGGASLMLTPTMYVALSQMQVLAPDGRCKAFDAAADGYGRGEGGAMVLLKRLRDAQADGDTVLAVIRGSAVNHDGAASGLTVPSKHAQEKLLRQALADARVSADEMAYLETHGTGTPLGDPIELRAIGTVFGHDRAEPLRVGTVKANIGHLEPAAGIAGFVKTVLALQHATIPRQIHFHTPNPHIEWDEFAVEVPVDNLPWPGGEGARRLAGVSAFGISGTNAHVVIEAAPPVVSTPAPARGTDLLVLSARSEAALNALAVRYQGHLQAHPAQALADLCRTAATGRQHHAHRLAIVAADRGELAARLGAVVDDRSGQGVLRGTAAAVAPRIAFLFTGQGSQYVGMGRSLYQTEPVFRAALDRCDTLLRGRLDRPLLEILHPADPTRDGEPMERAGQAQPALFALEYALACLWRAWGVEPEVMIGHSLGEIVAACVAGVFSLDDALTLVAARGRLMEALPQDGDMVALHAGEDRVRPLLAGLEDQVAIAAVNAPDRVVLSGRRDTVARLVAQLAAQGVRARPLQVTHAFHSPLMAPMLEDFRRVAAGLRYERPTLPVVSNLTGRLAGDEILSADYWVRHVREAVRFADGVATLQALGCSIFLEVGPQPVLSSLVADTLGSDQAVTLASLRRGQADGPELLASLGALYVRGVAPDWIGVDQGHARRSVLLPTYPFQRRPCWTTRPAPRRPASLHPLIERRFELPLHDEQVFEADFSLQTQPALAEHRVFGAVVSPGAYQLAMALAAATLANGRAETPVALLEVVFPQALVLPEGGSRRVQAVIGAAPEGDSDVRQTFKVASFTPEGAARDLLTHAKGRLAPAAAPAAAGHGLAALQQRCTRPGDASLVYSRAQAARIELGAPFRWIAEVWNGSTADRPEALGRLTPPTGTLDDHRLHPGLLDACFQVASLARHDAGAGTLLPFAVEALRLYRPARGEVWWCHAVQVEPDAWDLRLFDSEGELLAEIEGFAMRAAQSSAIRRAPDWHDWLYQVAWPRSPFGGAAGHLPAPAEAIGDLTAALAPRWAAEGGAAYEQCVADLEALSGAYVQAAFTRAGLRLEPGARWRTGQIARQLGVIPACHRLLGRMLAILAEQGVLRHEGGEDWTVLQTPPTDDVAARVARFQADHGLPPEAVLLTRCGERLDDVLRGAQEPLELLFPGGDTSTAHRLYADSPIHRLMNAQVRDVAARLVARLPADQGLRLLEIGGGTGGTTVGLLPLLPVDRTDYLFTDIGTSFIHRARERFAAYPFLRGQTLDIERSPLAQGFGRHQADVVLAANVLHATRDIATTLAHVRTLIQPGGHLLLLEVTARSRWVDLTFGLTDGWWRFEDQRQDHPLLDADQWRAALQAQGFTDVAVLAQSGHALIVARADAVARPLPAPAVARQWLVLADRQGVGQALAQRLHRQGDHATVLGADQTDEVRHLLASRPALHGVVHLQGLDTPDLAPQDDPVAAMTPAGASLLQVTQALLQGSPPPAGLWCVTRQAQAVAPDDPVSGVLQAGLWGMGRVIDQEHPELGCVRIDLGAGTDADADVDVETEADLLLAELNAATPGTERERQIALRGSRRHTARLARATVAPTAPIHCDPEASYLITGGLGGLGLATAAWLVERGARHLVLAGRRAPSEDARSRIDALIAQGARVVVARCDVGDRDAVARLLAGVDPRHPLRGVVHAVGVLDDGTLLHQDWSRFVGVLTPKVRGAWYLHALTQHLPLDFFVLYSAAAGLLGNRGQANHAAANTVLDALAAHRRARGLPALAIDWGAWADIGAAAQLMRQSQAELVSRGLTAMPPDQGIAALAGLIGQPLAQVGVMAIDWGAYLQAEAMRLPYFSELLPAARAVTATAPAPAAAARTTLRQRLTDAAPQERAAELTTWLQQAVAETLRLPELPDLQTGFSDMGMDSLMTIELRRHLVKALEQPLPSTIAFEYPSIELLRDYLLHEVLAEPAPAAAVEVTPAPVAVLVETPDPDDLEALSDAELDALVEQALARLDD
jgi:acyl transferase domain-containing protein/phospholipid N-methyltransferase